MPINKFMRVALKALSYSAPDLRKSYFWERSVRELKAPALKSLYRRWDRHIYIDGREIQTRIYEAPSPVADRVLLFFHGGGWVTENIDTYNSVCHNLARNTRSTVISVEYRLAPEYPFPAGLEDCYAVAKAVSAHRNWRVTLIGDSAGGNLAAAVSLLAHDRGEFMPERQILIYPATYNDHSETSPFESVRSNGTDYLLTARRVGEYMDLYKSSDDDLQSPYFAPYLAGDLRGQPATLIISAEYDPLRDEGEAYGRRLLEAGNTVSIHRMTDALHGFLSLGPRYVHVRRTYALIDRFLSDTDPR